VLHSPLRLSTSDELTVPSPFPRAVPWRLNLTLLFILSAFLRSGSSSDAIRLATHLALYITQIAYLLEIFSAEWQIPDATRNENTLDMDQTAADQKKGRTRLAVLMENK
jgi:hypothetical protein